MEIIEPLLRMLISFWPIAVVLGFFGILTAIFKGRWFKGKAGEAMTGGIIRAILSNEYIMLNDVLLSRIDKAEMTTQVDHIIVSKYGLFVLETKNYRGKIYGTANSKYWTYYPGGKKTSFQNPLHQNFLHTQTLAALLNIPHEAINSCIVFCGESEFKKEIAENVGSIRKIRKYIQTFKDVVFTDQQVTQIVDLINAGKLSNTHSNRKAHNKNLSTAKSLN